MAMKVQNGRNHILHVSYRPPFFIYMVFTCFLQPPFFHLHGFYRVTNITFPDFLQHWLELFTRSSHGLAKQFTCFLTKAETVKVRKIIYRFLHVLQMIIVDKDNVNHYLRTFTCCTKSCKFPGILFYKTLTCKL